MYVPKQNFNCSLKVLVKYVLRKLGLRGSLKMNNKILLLCTSLFFLGGGGVGWELIRGWALINFFYLQGEHLFQLGACSRLGA